MLRMGHSDLSQATYSGDPAWKRLIDSSPASDALRISLITEIFSDSDKTEAAKGLCGGDAQSFVDVVEEILDSLGPPLRQKCLSVLCKICSRQALLPRSLQIPLCYNRSDDPLYIGGFADVWKGEYQGTKVAVNVLRVESSDFNEIGSRFCKQVITWRSLRHPNVLPLLGVTMCNKRFSTISEWMDNGNINEFIKVHRTANRFELLKDVTRGLIYMHDQAMIHADLKGLNILIDRNGHARLADFGLLAFVLDPTNTTPSISDTNLGDTPRWMSPELLHPQLFGFNDSRPTKESDCYALGMVILEVLSGQAPFACDNVIIVMRKVVDSERPERPEEVWFTDDLWGGLEQCWSSHPGTRPAVRAILECLDRVSLSITIDSQQRLISRSFSQGELPSLLETIFWNKEPVDVVQSLQGGEAQALVDILDEALSCPNLQSEVRDKCIDSLHKTCAHYALFPSSLRIELCDNPTDIVLHRGGFGNVSKRSYRGKEVAVKMLEVNGELKTILSRFCKEFVSWKALRHPNVLPLIGVIVAETEFAMVSEWMPHGNINQFMEGHQGANQFELLSDVAKGLAYIHNQGVIHGDLKGANILVDQTCRARLADFGLLTFLPDATTSNPYARNGTIRWMSPELLDPEVHDHRQTKYSDCYGLGMVIYEVLSRRVPFYQYADFSVFEKVIQGDRPERPEGAEGVWFTDDIWEVLERCWVPTPRDRPSVDDVLRCLEKTLAPPFHITSTRDSPTKRATFQNATAGSDASEMNPTETLLQLDGSSPQFLNHFAWREFEKSIESLERDDLVRIVERLDQALDGLSTASFTFKRTHRKLQRICISRNLFPSSHVLNGTLDIDRHPFSSGGFSDVYKGMYDGLEVCVKKLRITPDTDSELAIKILSREALPWKRLTHPNIVPFIGVTIHPPQIASKWMPSGNLTTYIKLNQQQDPVFLLVDVAKGLDYMHSQGMIHGDLKGPNILVDGSGHARITDFGLVQDTSSVVSIAEGQSTRWTAPEILEETGIPSIEADVFSFGMVMVEVFTGTVPFSDHTSPAAMVAILSRKRPPRPAHSSLTDRLWKLMARCWGHDPHDRPQMLEVLLPLIRERTRPTEPQPVAADVQTTVLDIQQRFANIDPSNEEYRPLLYALLAHRDLKPHIDDLRMDDLQGFIGLLDEALTHIPVADDLFRKALRRLQSTCGDHQILPLSYLIPGGRLSKRGKSFVAGGSADAQEGEFDGEKVSIKTLRPDVQRKTFYRGVTVWKRLQHPNIVPFLGIPAKTPALEIVCDWMEHGTITEYVKRNPAVDRIDLLWDVVEGLHHLHLYHIVHGDLKGANVLIDKNGHARLADFGLASIVPGNQSVVSLPDANVTIATTWAAPEISNGGSLTKAGDIFTFAMVAVETFTAHRQSIKCYTAVLTGGRPEQAKLPDDLWNLMQRCWNRDPGKRPTSFELVDFFRLLFPKELETSEIQTYSIAALSDKTWAYCDSKDTRSHSDSLQVEPPTGEGDSKLPGNTSDLDPHLQVPLRKLKSRPRARGWRRKLMGKRSGSLSTESDPNIMHNSTTPEPGPPTLEQRQVILGEKVDQRPQAKDIDRPEARQKTLERKVDRRPEAADVGELEVRRKILDKKVDRRPQAEDVGQLEGRRNFLERKVDRRPQAEDIGQLEARQKILEKKVDRRPPAKDIEARQKILQGKLELRPEAKDVLRGIVFESVGGQS